MVTRHLPCLPLFNREAAYPSSCLLLFYSVLTETLSAQVPQLPSQLMGKQGHPWRPFGVRWRCLMWILEHPQICKIQWQVSWLHLSPLSFKPTIWELGCPPKYWWLCDSWDDNSPQNSRFWKLWWCLWMCKSDCTVYVKATGNKMSEFLNCWWKSSFYHYS